MIIYGWMNHLSNVRSSGLTNLEDAKRVCNRSIVVGIESVQFLPNQSM